MYAGGLCTVSIQWYTHGDTSLGKLNLLPMFATTKPCGGNNRLSLCQVASKLLGSLRVQLSMVSLLNPRNHIELLPQVSG